jgi:heptosyltransferase I
LKVLIIRLSAMGDIIHGLPAAALLRDRLPDLELSWLVEAAGVPLLARNPAVDRVIVFPKRKWLEQLRSVSGIGATAAEAGSFVGSLKELKLDAVLDLQGLFKSSFLGFLSGANLRFGFKGTREGAERLLTHALDVGDYFGRGAHVVDLNLRLARHACRVLLGEPSDTEAAETSSSFIYGPARFPLPAPPTETVAALRSRLSDQGLRPPSPLIAFVPGSTWETKIWPVHHWRRLAELCLSRVAGPLVLLGGARERDTSAAIAAGLADRVLDLTGRTDIDDLLAVFQETDIVVGADTGPLHLAAAAGKAKVIAVFGSTPAARNGPYGAQCLSVNLELDCQPCFKKICPLATLACLKNLAPETVFEHVLEFGGLGARS